MNTVAANTAPVKAAYAATVTPIGFAPRNAGGFYCDPMNAAAVTEVVLSNGLHAWQVGPMGVIYASKAVAVAKATERRIKIEAEQVKAAQEAARIEAEKQAAEYAARKALEVPSYDAESWAWTILGELASVSTPEQKDHARYLLCDDWLSGKTVSNFGPSLESLREDIELAALAAKYDPSDYPDSYSPLECEEMDEARMVAPIVTEADVCPPSRKPVDLLDDFVRCMTTWAQEITSKLIHVATEEQIAAACIILDSPELFRGKGRVSTPSLSELRVLAASKPAPVRKPRRKKVNAAKARRMMAAV